MSDDGDYKETSQRRLEETTSLKRPQKTLPRKTSPQKGRPEQRIHSPTPLSTLSEDENRFLMSHQLKLVNLIIS